MNFEFEFETRAIFGMKARLEAMGSLPFQDQFNGFYRPDSFTTIDTGYVAGPCSGHLSSVAAAKKLHEIGQTDTSITGCDSPHVIGMVEPMDRPLVNNGEKLGQPGLFTSSPLEDLHQKSLNYTETQWRDDCGPPAPHSSENDLLESFGPKDRSNWYKGIFMNVAREMIHESEMRMGSLPVQDPSDGLSWKHQLSPMGPLPSNEGYVKDFLGSGISNAPILGSSKWVTAMNKSHGNDSGGAATPLTGVITLI